MNTLGTVHQKLRRKPVTLIVGIICRDGIVVASDSQTTWGSGKRYDAKKMTEIGHAYGRALVAESGATITSAACVEALAKIANDRALYDVGGLGGLSEKALLKVREKLRAQYFDCDAEGLQDIIERNGLDAELMIANYEGRTPRIDTISLTIGIATRAQSFFEAVGSGSDLANYLLTDLCTPEMDFTTGSVVALHIVETAKRHDPYCGGPTKIGILPVPKPKPMTLPESFVHGVPPFPPLLEYYTPPVILPQSETDEILQLVAAIDSDTRNKRSEIIQEALARRSNAIRSNVEKWLEDAIIVPVDD